MGIGIEFKRFLDERRLLKIGEGEKPLCAACRVKGEEADYGLKFSEAGALDIIENAEKLLKKAKELLKT